MSLVGSIKLLVQRDCVMDGRVAAKVTTEETENDANEKKIRFSIFIITPLKHFLPQSYSEFI